MNRQKRAASRLMRFYVKHRKNKDTILCINIEAKDGRHYTIRVREI